MRWLRDKLRAMAAPRYQDPIFPEGCTHFLLIDDNGVDDGPYRVDDFAKNSNDGTWAAQTEGRPLFLRIKRQSGNQIWTVDGAGVEHHFHITPVEVAASSRRGA